MRRTVSALAFMMFAAYAQAFAQADGNPANWCRNGAFTSDSQQFGLARVTGARRSRVHFYGDEEGCPGPAAKCRQRAYVVAGDEVLTSRAFGDWVCAWFQPARGTETVGWLPADRLAPKALSERPALAAWLGAWGFYDNSLRVKRGRRAGSLLVEGEATWQGANPGNVHVGDLRMEAAPAGNALTLGDDPEDCRATLRLVGHYLVVSDNKRCGGLNVTFDGVYRRARR